MRKRAVFERPIYLAALYAGLAGMLFAALIVGCSQPSQDVQAASIDVSAILRARQVDPQKAALYIVRLKDGQTWNAGGSRLDSRFSPASTSKIPHTLIALETKLAQPAKPIFKWDGTKRTFKAWNQDQTLSTAFQRSAVWVYQDITFRLGHETMTRYINAFGYGNADIGGEFDLTQYWLTGPLAISAREQTDFLARLAKRSLNLAPQTYEDANKIMRTAQAGERALYAKTGWYWNEDGADIGWYVGWISGKLQDGTQTPLYVFAYNMDMLTRKDRRKRIPVVRAALAQIDAFSAQE